MVGFRGMIAAALIASVNEVINPARNILLTKFKSLTLNASVRVISIIKEETVRARNRV